jgi:phytoene synthase
VRALCLWWREALEEIYEKDHVRRNETVQALDFAIKAYDLPRQPFDALIDARTFDLYNEPMATWDQLEDYLGATAGGLMSLAMRIAAPAIDMSKDQIRGLGIAWGSIGLLRALTIHSQRRQLYLPLELLTKHQIDIEDVLSGKAGEGLAGICDDVLTRTKSHLKNSKHDLASDGLPAVLYVRLIRAYARLIEGNSRDLFDRDLKLSPLKKRLSLLMGNLTGTI